MADEKVLRPKSFRLDDETADKFRKIGESIGANQQETLERLIQAYELQVGKSTLTERKADMEKFEGYVAILNRMYMASLEENQHITDVVRESFEDALKSKDQTIQDLQKRESKALCDMNEAVNLMEAYKKESEDLRKELEASQKSCETVKASLADKDQLNKALTDTCNELRAKVESLKEDQQQMEDLRKDLEAVKEAKQAAEKQLKEEQAAGKKALEDLREKMEVAQERAVLEAEKRLQKEHEEQIREINQRYAELIAAKLQADQRPEEETKDK